MFHWIEELLEIKHRFRERKLLQQSESNKTICQSCEVLKTALERANYEKDQLLSRILEVPKEPIGEANQGRMIPPKNIPWHIRRQMLEAEDRQKARLMKESVTPDVPKSTEELEKDITEAL